MPPLNRDEAAVTQSKFACGVKLEVEIAQAGNEKPTARIAGVDATLKLDVMVWLPIGVSAKIRAHEEGHRQGDRDHQHERADELSYICRG